jgi:hypothetical protein
MSGRRRVTAIAAKKRAAADKDLAARCPACGEEWGRHDGDRCPKTKATPRAIGAKRAARLAHVADMARSLEEAIPDRMKPAPAAQLLARLVAELAGIVAELDAL